MLLALISPWVWLALAQGDKRPERCSEAYVVLELSARPWRMRSMVASSTAEGWTALVVPALCRQLGCESGSANNLTQTGFICITITLQLM